MAIPKFLKMVAGRLTEAVMTALEVTDTLGYVPREKLAAARTYYVRTDGNDANTGLVDSAGGAFLTIQKAVDVAAALDNGGYNITISIAAGTYTAGATLKSFVGSGYILIRGGTADRTSTLISTTSANCFTSGGHDGLYRIQYLKMQTTTGGACYSAWGRGATYFGYVTFGACAASHLSVNQNASVLMEYDYSISGGATAHWAVNQQARLTVNSGTITITGTPAFSAFATANLQSQISGWYATTTFSGSATGSRYSVNNSSVISFGGSATYLPGNAAGNVWDALSSYS
jgi:hypothetical protein